MLHAPYTSYLLLLVVNIPTAGDWLLASLTPLMRALLCKLENHECIEFPS